MEQKMLILDVEVSRVDKIKHGSGLNSYTKDNFYFKFNKIEKQTVFNSTTEAVGHFLKDKKTIDNLSEINNVYFIRGTKFNRDLFRSIHKSKKIKKVPNNADCIIYDDQIIKTGRTRNTVFCYGDTKISFARDCIFLKNYNSHDNQTKSIYDFIDNKEDLEKELSEQELADIKQMYPSYYYTQRSYYTVYSIDETKIVESDLPYIHVSDVFIDKADVDVDIDENKINELVDQLHSKNEEERILAYSSLFILPHQKYGNLQAFIYFLNQDLGRAKRSKIIEQYDKMINAKITNSSAFKKSNQQYHNNYTYRFVQHYITSICSNNHSVPIVYNIFYAYKIIRDCNKELFNDMPMDLVNFAADKIMKKYTRVPLMNTDEFTIKLDAVVNDLKEKIVDVEVEPETEKQEFDWGV